jgi:hypothetical protein
MLYCGNGAPAIYKSLDMLHYIVVGRIILVQLFDLVTVYRCAAGDRWTRQLAIPDADRVGGLDARRLTHATQSDSSLRRFPLPAV